MELIVIAMAVTAVFASHMTNPHIPSEEEMYDMR